MYCCRGFGAATLRLVPSAVISFGAYELIQRLWLEMEARQDANTAMSHYQRLQPINASLDQGCSLQAVLQGDCTAPGGSTCTAQQAAGPSGTACSGTACTNSTGSSGSSAACITCSLQPQQPSISGATATGSTGACSVCSMCSLPPGNPCSLASSAGAAGAACGAAGVSGAGGGGGGAGVSNSISSSSDSEIGSTGQGVAAVAEGCATGCLLPSALAGNTQGRQ